MDLEIRVKLSQLKPTCERATDNQRDRATMSLLDKKHVKEFKTSQNMNVERDLNFILLINCFCYIG